MKHNNSPTPAYCELRDAYIASQYFPNYYKGETGESVCINNIELRQILDKIITNKLDTATKLYLKSIPENCEFYINELKKQQKDTTDIYKHKKYELKLSDYLRVG